LQTAFISHPVDKRAIFREAVCKSVGQTLYIQEVARCPNVVNSKLAARVLSIIEQELLQKESELRPLKRTLRVHDT
jgi:hypothetical protein